MSFDPTTQLITTQNDFKSISTKRYLKKTKLIAKKEYCLTCRHMLALSCLVAIIVYPIFSLLNLVLSIPYVINFAVSAICSFTTGLISLGIQSKKKEDFDSYFSPKTLELANPFYVENEIDDFFNFKIPIEELDNYVKYGILTKKTALDYSSLYKRIIQYNDSLEQVYEEMKKNENSISYITLIFSPNSKVNNNDMTLPSQNNLLKDPNYQIYEKRKNELLMAQHQIEVLRQDIEKEKLILIDTLKNELPTFDTSKELDLTCYSLFCKNI